MPATNNTAPVAITLNLTYAQLKALQDVLARDVEDEEGLCADSDEEREEILERSGHAVKVDLLDTISQAADLHLAGVFAESDYLAAKASSKDPNVVGPALTALSKAKIEIEAFQEVCCPELAEAKRWINATVNRY